MNKELEENAIYRSYADFVQKLCSTILEHERELKNTFISPLSLYLTMAMISMGCNGKTKHDLVKALNLPTQYNEYKMHTANATLLTRGLVSTGYFRVYSAHRLFMLSPVDVEQKYAKDIFKYYTTKWENLGKMKNNESKRRYINDWVGEMTQYHVQDLLPLSSISEDTLLTMVDAFYVKGTWRERFPEKCTTYRPFYRVTGSAMEVKMMSTRGLFRYQYLPDAKARVLKLPLGDFDWEYLIVLPDEVIGLRSVLNYLATGDNFIEMLNAPFQLVSVQLALPRFKIGDEPSINIKRLLCSMGAASIFRNHEKELTGICKSTSVYMSDIFHKVVIQIDEEGAGEAPSEKTLSSIPLDIASIEFNVDHPFVLAVIYKQRIPVFLGHVMTPNSR